MGVKAHTQLIKRQIAEIRALRAELEKGDAAWDELNKELEEAQAEISELRPQAERMSDMDAHDEAAADHAWFEYGERRGW